MIGSDQAAVRAWCKAERQRLVAVRSVVGTAERAAVLEAVVEPTTR